MGFMSKVGEVAGEICGNQTDEYNIINKYQIISRIKNNNNLHQQSDLNLNNTEWAD